MAISSWPPSSLATKRSRLSPDRSADIGKTTLTDNLAQAIAINNSATLPLQELSYSDKNLLGSASNTVMGISGSFGVAANLAGGLPDQPPVTGGAVPGVQRVGGYGATALTQTSDRPTG